MFVRYFVELPVAFEAVQRSLLRSPEAAFTGSAREATERGERLLADVGFLSGRTHFSKRVRISLREAWRSADGMRIPFSWEATGLDCLFPSMEAELEAAPLGAGTTQIAISASYEPPLRMLGRAVDRAFMHRIAEATVKTFLDAIASRMMAALALAPGA